MKKESKMPGEDLTHRQEAIRELDEQVIQAIEIYGGGIDGKLFAAFEHENNLSHLPEVFVARSLESAVDDYGIYEWQLIYYGPRSSSLYTKLIPENHLELPFGLRQLHAPLSEPDVFYHRPPLATGGTKLKRAPLELIEGMATLLSGGPTRPELKQSLSFKEFTLEALRAMLPRRKRYGD